MRVISQNQTGFTLLELLIAISIFAIGLLAIAGLQVSAIRYNAGSNVRSTAIGIAQEVLEQVMAMDGDNVLFQADNPNMVWDLDPNTAATTLTLPGGGTYSATWSVETDTPVSRVSRITVTVQAPQSRVTTLTSFRRYYF